ncbi:MAG: Smr/MutS family protein [Xanthobacteraceae bacterium]
MSEGNEPRRRRKLREDERALWRQITRSVRRLRPEAESEVDAGAPQPPPPTQAGLPPAAAKRKTAKASATALAAVPPLAPLGRRVKQRLARGTLAIDGRLDLHGFTQASAHDALLAFLRKARGNDWKVALVITGKGARLGDSTGDRGVLRRQVPLWLKLPEFRAHVVSFEGAHIGHGGDGALYVRIRRRGAE